MVNHRKYKKPSGCKSSAKVVGSHVTVHVTCPIKAVRTKLSKKASKVRRTKHTDVPAACKGLKKKARKSCAKRVCEQRPEPYRTDCKKKAGVR